MKTSSPEKGTVVVGKDELNSSDCSQGWIEPERDQQGH